ncbi:hypothetical protein WOLCODRAFT_79777 [Wolfiporia cocos MD-104 SS10]|uniref:DUF6699 domain-containing protein n=1 Tax=Wolfiporia cocos (strain MD-104) TaxID=742152 RepID=A0A2H3IZ70_WOLCO|nr:hypothetical protein WOLCODRAFT_79777 [Wolfiporia cocos MD-104 SS10]
MTAKHINARGSIVDFTSKLDDPVTHPPVRTVHIYCNSWMAHNQWGPIVIDKRRTVNVWDVLIAIYDFYRVPLTQQEVQHISSLDGDNYRRMLDAYYQRCMRTPALPGYEVQQGMKRADCLGRNTIFWGLWITLNADNTWQMNLGLVPPSHS